MTRKKVKLAYITDDSARKATFKKRKKGLIKKVEELSILCDIDVCMIICSPYDAQPEVYPSSSGVQRVLARFKNMPEIVQSKKMVNQESFLRNRIAKANEQLEKQREENREKEITRIMFQTLMGAKGLLGLSIVDLKDLRWLIEQKLMNIKMRIERIGEDDTETKVCLEPNKTKLNLAGVHLASTAGHIRQPLISNVIFIESHVN
ncbi:agamous-like MADS-box protein AGL80 [Morus notabilis]|uniref:agamous-like MADS-box protein AGL80 n=1 Tax=Morus notabilis TaxID=981085 RepID=UPI000CED2EEA|nr:agamous-like MADS-box protein AGL80 [Morus notabilis]